jgi:hypothetical protein
MMTKLKLQKYWSDPFGFVDNLNLTVKGNNLNIFQKYQRLQKTALTVSLVMLFLWAIMGFDSTIAQILHPMYALPNLLLGKISLQDLINIFNSQYGKDMHLSAFVIYGLCFYSLSRHFEKIGIVKSKNVAYSVAITLFTVGLFEFYWMGSYAYFQNQPWVLKLQFPQLRIILQNLAFISIGTIGILYMWTDCFTLNEHKEIVGRNYRFNWNIYSVLLVISSVAMGLLWWFYPFPIQHFSVTLTNGQVWTNSAMFPQTLYTIDLNPIDSINAGEWFWIENDLVHFVNTFTKALWTYTIYFIAKLRLQK